MSKKNNQQVTSIDFLDWINDKPKSKADSSKKKLKYPIFKTLADKIEHDQQKSNNAESWIEILNKSANGIFPDYFSVCKNNLIYNDGEIIEKISLKNITLENCINFFSKSPEFDISDSDSEYLSDSDQNQEAKEKTWAELNVNNKINLIYVFCNQEKINKKLTPIEFKKLKSLLNNAHHSKFLTDKKVILSNRIITKIVGLEWNSIDRIYRLDKFDPTKISSNKSKKIGHKISKEKDVYPGFQKHWGKMVDLWDKKYLQTSNEKKSRKHKNSYSQSRISLSEISSVSKSKLEFDSEDDLKSSTKSSTKSRPESDSSNYHSDFSDDSEND